MTYDVFIERSAQRTLAKITQPHQDRIIRAIDNLHDNPRPSGALKLTGRPAWRIRIGDYRVIYEIDDYKTTVLVVSIGHRKKIYESGR